MRPDPVTVVARPIAIPAAAAGAGEQRRVPELDGVRAIAIWLVLAVHLGLRGTPPSAAQTLHGLPRLGYLALSHAWLGVDLFFVLSGFLITGILLDTKHRATYLRDFWVRRALRILPLVAAVLIVLATFVAGHAAWFTLGALFLADVAPLFHIGAFRGAPPLWSLAVEEQFYLLWPFVVLAFSARRLAWLAGAIVVIEPIARLLWPDAAFEIAWFRWDGLAVGALAALCVRAPRADAVARTAMWAAIGIVLALLGTEALVRTEAFSGAMRITEADLLFGAGILAAVTWSGSRWTAPLRSTPCRIAAETSFCVYLIHVPLMELAETMGISSVASPVLATALRLLIVLPVTMALAILSWRYFESPILRLKRVFAP